MKLVTSPLLTATSHTIIIKTTGIYGRPQSVVLSFNSSSFRTPFTNRRINVAPGLMYHLICSSLRNSNTWSNEGQAVTPNTSQSVHVLSPDNYTSTLVFTSFSSSDVGLYSCSNSGETLTLDIVTGECDPCRTVASSLEVVRPYCIFTSSSSS